FSLHTLAMSSYIYTHSLHDALPIYLTYYNNYGSVTSKPTRFKANLDLNLKRERLPNEIAFKQVSGYNTRSNIPAELVECIFEKRSEEHTSELQSRFDLVCRLLLEKK